jgi:hypothetical protein
VKYHWVRGVFVGGTVAMAALLLAMMSEPAAVARVAPGVHPIILPGLTYMGNASCAGSNCHSADKATEQSGQLIGDESNIWSESDPHAHAYTTLENDASKAIAAKLKLASATGAAQCLACHSMNVPKAQQGELFSFENGAGCESCHGPGQKYLNPHAEKGWTAKQRGALGGQGLIDQFGLVDTSNLAIRAHTCVACHLQIDKDMIDAGHPPLEFELYAYNYYVSKKADKQYAQHWTEPTDKMQDARLWAAGQVAALEAAGAQTAAWKAKGWDTAQSAALEKLYKTGAEIAARHLGVKTAADAQGAKLSAAQTSAAAAELAGSAAGAGDAIQRRVIAFGVAALGASTFEAKGAAAPDAFWDAYNAAVSGATDGGDAYVAGVKKMAELTK